MSVFAEIKSQQLLAAKAILDANRADFRGTEEELETLIIEQGRLNTLVANGGTGVQIFLKCPTIVLDTGTGTGTSDVDTTFYRMVTPQYGRSPTGTPFILVPSIVPCPSLIPDYEEPVEGGVPFPPEPPEPPPAPENPQIFTVTGTFTWPDGVTQVLAECWGGGGGASMGGGGGGAYSAGLVSKVGDTDPVQVGVGGNGGAWNGSGTNGLASFFRDATTVKADAGKAGVSDGGGLGGEVGECVGTTIHTGGNGGDGDGGAPDGSGGGGGGSGGTTTNGGNGTAGAAGGPAGTGGTAGSADGAVGGDGGLENVNGNLGGAPGGGGGGGGINANGAAGQRGQVRVSW